MKLGDIRDGLKERLETIPGLRVDRGMSSPINPPQAVIKPAEHNRHQRERLSILRFEVWVLVSRGYERAAEALLDEFMGDEGDKSVLEAIEADTTLGGRVDDATAMGWDSYGTVRFDINDPAYLGARFNVEIIPS